MILEKKSQEYSGGSMNILRQNRMKKKTLKSKAALNEPTPSANDRKESEMILWKSKTVDQKTQTIQKNPLQRKETWAQVAKNLETVR